MRYVYLLIFIIISAVSANAGGQTYSVSGELTADGSTDFTTLQVELHNLSAIGPPIERADVSYDGRFELRSVPEGQYNLVVRTGLGAQLYRDVVSIHSFEVRLSIKLPSSRKERPISGLVSLKQLEHKPPKAARKAFEKAAKLFEKKDIAGSLAALEKAVEIDPEFVPALNNLGARYVLTGRFEEAISTFQKALEIDPDAPMVHTNLAQAFIHKGKITEAEKEARKAIDLDREDPRPAYLLGLSLVMQKKYTAEAMDNLHRSEDFYPRARLTLAVAQAQTGSFKDARKTLSSCLQSPEAPVRAEAQKMLMSLRSAD